jgi:hypothetical protein
VTARQHKFHGRIEGAAERCGVAGCAEPGEFRAPVTPGDFDGPGQWRYLCLDHVRAHNSSYNFFNGMSPDEIEEAQSPIAGWERHSRPFAHGGGDPPPAWSNFTDPLDAIAARFRTRREDGTRPGGSGWGEPDRFTPAERHALGVLGLKQDIDRTTLRQRYSELVRRYHPDRNGGDRSHERALAEVIEAYQRLKGAAGFA